MSAVIPQARWLYQQTALCSALAPVSSSLCSSCCGVQWTGQDHGLGCVPVIFFWRASQSVFFFFLSASQRTNFSLVHLSALMCAQDETKPWITRLRKLRIGGVLRATYPLCQLIGREKQQWHFFKELHDSFLPNASADYSFCCLCSPTTCCCCWFCFFAHLLFPLTSFQCSCGCWQLKSKLEPTLHTALYIILWLYYADYTDHK